MLMRLKYLLFVFLCLIFCRERANIFDFRSDDFIPPPPIALTWPSEVFYDPSGQLIGVRIQIDFSEKFEKALTINHIFYQDISERVRFDVGVEKGTISYAIDIYGPYAEGDYCLKIYFGEMPIGSCPFSVVSSNGKLVIKGVVQDEIVSININTWFMSVDF